MTNNMHNNNFDTPARVPLDPIIDNTPARIPLKSFNNSISNYIIYNTIEEAVMSIKYEEFYKDELFAFIVHSPITPNVMYHRYLISNYGRVYDLCNKRFLAASFTTKVRGYLGYKRIKLALYVNPYNIIHKDCYIHRLVAYYFLYFPSCELLEVNHKNGDHSNNVWTNLEWVTGEYNRYHAKVNNIIPRGEQKIMLLLLINKLKLYASI